jgi:hypothetical protein
MDEWQPEFVAVKLDGLPKFPGGSGRVMYALQNRLSRWHNVLL